MQTESDTYMVYTPTEHHQPTDELDRAHDEFLAEILRLDGKAAQRLFKTIAEDGTDIVAPALSGDRQQNVSAG